MGGNRIMKRLLSVLISVLCIATVVWMIDLQNPDEAYANYTVGVPYSQSGNGPYWGGSTAQRWCELFYTNLFSEEEKAYILDAAVEEGNYNTSSDFVELNGKKYGPWTLTAGDGKDLVFCLSAKQIQAYFNYATGNDENLIGKKPDGTNLGWWLRSGDKTPNYTYYVAFISSMGGISSTYSANSNFGARPAFFLDLSQGISGTFTTSDGHRTWTVGSGSGEAGTISAASLKPYHTAGALTDDYDYVVMGNNIPEVTGMAGETLWRVLDVDTENNRALLLSEYVWLGNGKPDAPTGLSAVNATATKAKDGAIIGLDSTKSYQYSYNGGLHVVPAGATEITGLSKGNYYVSLVNVPGNTESSDSVYLNVGVRTPPEITVPKKSAPTIAYNGTAQKLVKPGSTNDGTMKYALGTAKEFPEQENAWSESVPVAIDAGTYYVWYKVVPGEEYGSIAPTGPVVVTVAKAANSVTPPQIEGWAEGATASSPSGSVARYGTPEYVYSTSENGTYTAAQPTTAGTYYCRAQVQGGKNYNAARSEATRFTISGKDSGGDTGTSSKAAEAAILGMTSDDDPAGSTILPLNVRSLKQTAASLKVQWTKQANAAKYIVYGNKCGASNKMARLRDTTKAAINFKTIAGKKVKKGTSYKFIVVAVDKNDKVLSTSKVIHVVAAGTKKGNPTKLTVKGVKKSLAVGKSFAVKCTVGKKAGTRVSVHTAKKYKGLRYESSNPEVAGVSPSGKVKATAAGKAKIIVYAQNGASKVITVTVK